ncbi:MAG: MarR family transcriptional regulator [bacterium]|nr:MarR family transcriptional regulator [bacterium]
MSENRKKALELHSSLNILTEEIYRQSQSFFSTEMANYSATEINIWKILGIKGKCKMRDISSILKIPNSTTTSIVDRMVKNEIVERSRSEEDRRVVFISLTEKGNKNWKMVLEQIINVYEYMLSLLSDEDQDELLRLFKKMNEQFFKNREGQSSVKT